MEGTDIIDMDSTMDKVVKEIYTCCDPDNIDAVPVSLLVEYIKPYMPDHSLELEALKTQLDPNHSDPTVSRQVFYKEMNVWSTKLKEKDSEDSFCQIDSNNLTPTQDEEKLPFRVSTPRPSVGYCQLLKNCSEMLNVSNISIYGTSESVSGFDKTHVEEHNKELQHLLQKTSYELDTLRQQLAVAEEQNELLLVDVGKITKQLHSEQQLTKQLENEKNNHEELKEENDLLKKKRCLLEKKLEQADKELQKVLQQISELETQKLTVETKLESISNRQLETKTTMNEMEEMIYLKDSEISTLIKLTDDLKRQIEEKNDLISFYTKENDELKHQTYSIEQLYEEQLAENSASMKEVCYNSPKFFAQIENPVSPTLSSPISPVYANGLEQGHSTKSARVPLIRQVLTRHTSTPNENLQRFGPYEMKSCPNIFSGTEEDICLKRNKSDCAFGANEHYSPPTMYVVDRSDSPKRPLKSLKDELSEVSLFSDHDAQQEEIEHFKNQISVQEEEIKRLKEQIKNQEDVKNKLWKDAKSAYKESESLKGYREDYETLVYTVEKNEGLIRQLETTLETSSCNLNRERSLNIELRNELEMEVKKHRDASFKLNQLLYKSVVDKETQTLSFSNEFSEAQEETKEKLVEKYLQEKGQNEFLLEVKESLEKLWNDNEIVVKKAEGAVGVICDKMRDYLSSSSFYSLDCKNGDGLLDKLGALEKAIDSLLTNRRAHAETQLDSTAKRTNYGKQQLKIDRISEKLVKTERDLFLERKSKIQLSGENIKIKEELDIALNTLQQQKDISDKHLNEIEKLKQKIVESEEDNGILKSERENLIQEIQRNELEFAHRENLLKKQVSDIQQAQSISSLHVQSLLSDKDEKLRTLEDLIDRFICINSAECGSAASAVVAKIKPVFDPGFDFDEGLDSVREEYPEETWSTPVERNLYGLRANIRIVLFLLQMITDSYRNLANTVQVADRNGSNEENLVSPSGYDVSFDFTLNPLEVSSIKNSNCSVEAENLVSPSGCDVTVDLAELSCESPQNSQQLWNIDQFSQEDTFLVNLELENSDLIRGLSKSELEEKFTVLALSLNLDSATSKKRCEKQIDKLNELLSKYSYSIDSSICALKRIQRNDDIKKTTISHLESLKNSAREIFETVHECGVLRYEVRTINCWNLVTNYVAILSRENKKLKQGAIKSDDCEEIGEIVNVPRQTLRCLSQMCRKSVSYSFTILAYLFILLVVMIVFAQWECLKLGGTRVCPIDYIFDLFVRKIAVKPAIY